MAKRLEKLTAEQAALIPAWRDEWLRIGLSCEDTTWEQARDAVHQAYRCANLPAPKIVLLMDSPIAGALAAAMMKKLGRGVGAQVRAQVRAQVGAQVGDQVRAQVRAQVGAQVGDQVRAQVGAQVWAQVGDQVGAQVWDQVWAQVRAQVRAQVGAQVGDQVRAQVGDQVGAQVWDQVGDQVGAQVWDQVGAQVGAQVWDQVGAQVGDQVRAQVWAQVWAQVRAQVRAQVGAQVGDQVRAQVGDQVRAQVGAQVWDQVGDQVYGCHDAGWISFYEFFRANCGIVTQADLGGLVNVAKTMGWWAPYDTLAVCQRRPLAIHRDDQFRLHSESGMAIQYRDGWGFYAWHGVRLGHDGEQIILRPQTQTIEQIDADENEEVRRIRIERFGWLRYLAETNAEVVHSRRNDIENTKEMLCRRGPMQVLVCHCPSTARVYALEVPREIATCEQAQNWLWNADGSRYGAARIIGRS
jgi:hypothetical protein